MKSATITGSKQTDQKLKFGRFLGLNNPVSSEVLYAAAANPEYLHNLIVSKNNHEFMNHLLENPAGTDAVNFSEQEIEKFVAEQERKLFHLEQKQAYEKRYGIFFEMEQKKDPEAEPCKPWAPLKTPDFREVYLDHNATTPVRPEVGRILAEYYNGKYGYDNPSSNTAQGYFTTAFINEARRRIANCLSAVPEEIFFTASGTEANNLAIKGAAFKYLNKKGHLITSKAEHPSVLRVMEYLETLDFSVTYLDVDQYGMVSPDSVQRAIRQDTVLVSVMAANNEIGTINPISKIGRICKKHNILFMVDAIQAFAKIPLNPKDMGISLLSFSGHKIYAPKGIGGLYIEKDLSLVPQIHGGGQESGRRSGTENVGAILAFARAAELAHSEMAKETARLLELRSFFLEGLKNVEPGYIVNGSLEHRIANNLSIGFPGVDSGALLRSLNRIGISVSAGSACSSKKINNSHVLKAIGADTKKYATIRFSFGLQTQKEDLSYLLKYLSKILHLIGKNK
ncbi:Cysteine desulfurase [Desulfofarcimen acetoxidans DSM 771]|uniref:Cysteine desulfurase n=1 Tax=Desulfofarcimen acetoxidans (strain ATCC 49208 / DSM 771 / KCTC 5769 / VKM B-1644 / 5575) TaxID=485916 RepID=C8W2F2_DESAS|nr:cysteine desulfurase family protein [Desulfofarcimen acetoxidans]ACV63636.1 Cysteine desulfurase [Desulfofarcimen acetoxidans DSM 771]